MGALGLLFLIAIIDVDEVSDALANANLLYLIPGWFLIMGATAAKTVRWIVLFRQSAVDVSFRRLFGTYLIGAFYGQFMPGSSVGGDAMRMAESSVDTGKTTNSIASVIIERGVGLTTIVTTASLILMFAQPEDIPLAVSLVIYGLAIAGISALVILRFGWFIPLITGVMERIKLGGFAEKIRLLSREMQGGLGEPRTILIMVIMSLLANFLSMSAFYLALLAVTDPVPYLSFISLVALIVTIEIVPVTPGALGIREGAYVFFLGYLGVAEADALSVGLLVRFLSWTQAILGGLILLERGVNRRTLKTSPGGD